MNPKFYLTTAISIFFLFIFPVFCCAQASTGEIQGTVSDASGAVIVNATVSAINQATHTTTKSTSDETGKYHLTVPEGTYEITVAGFVGAKKSNVTVRSDAPATADFLLLVPGGERESVQVTAMGAMLNCNSSLPIANEAVRAAPGLSYLLYSVWSNPYKDRSTEELHTEFEGALKLSKSPKSLRQRTRQFYSELSDLHLIDNSLKSQLEQYQCTYHLDFERPEDYSASNMQKRELRATFQAALGEYVKEMKVLVKLRYIVSELASRHDLTGSEARRYLEFASQNQLIGPEADVPLVA